jgi:hypothetical protein
MMSGGREGLGVVWGEKVLSRPSTLLSDKSKNKFKLGELELFKKSSRIWFPNCSNTPLPSGPAPLPPSRSPSPSPSPSATAHALPVKLFRTLARALSSLFPLFSSLLPEPS